MFGVKVRHTTTTMLALFGAGLEGRSVLQRPFDDLRGGPQQFEQARSAGRIQRTESAQVDVAVLRASRDAPRTGAK